MFRGLSKLKREGDRHNAGPTGSQGGKTKSDLALTAPKRIVRALYPYTAQQKDELSFTRNDFFYVTEEPSGDWYVALNPLKNQKGLVPQSYFEVIQRQDHAEALSLSQARRNHSRSASQASATGMVPGPSPQESGAFSAAHRPQRSQGSTGSRGSGSQLFLYGYVLYDFTAERNDELSVSAGESIVITAQSNEEWFVAKPIGRLGGPGLIPVSYVELREVGTDAPITNVQDAIRRAGVPQVEEWKRRLAEYKASSIPLGRFGATSEQVESHSRSSSHGSDAGRYPVDARGYAHSRSASGTQQPHYQHQHQQYYRQSAGSHHSNAALSSSNNASGGGNVTAGVPNASAQRSVGHGRQGSASGGRTLLVAGSSTTPYVTSATVDRFAINGGRYWYLVKAELSNGKYRNLCRFYQDFYDFQIRLLEEFPEEAGRTGKTRTLPFMPGPLTLVTHTVSSQRRANLDDYVRDLIRMPPHLSRSPVVMQLFELRQGDVESDGPTQQLPQPPDEESREYSGDLPEYSGLASTQGSSSQSVSSGLQAPTAASRPDGPSRASAAAAIGPGTASISPHSAQPFKDRSASGRDAEQPTLKIKVYAKDNVVAIRVPAETPFSDIYARISTRLDVEGPALYTAPDFSGEPVSDAGSFARALNGSNKIALYLGK